MNIDNLERAKLFLSYDADTGYFHWKIRPNGRTNMGVPAGHIDSKGHRQIHVCKEFVLAHRLAWYFVHGEWPPSDIDHIDRNKDNNRIANLRQATRQQNIWNAGPKRTNKSGHKGVVWHKAVGKWYASIRRDGRQEYLGVFPNLEDAVAAYEGAAKETHGEFYYRGQ